MTSKTLEKLDELMRSEDLAYKKCCNYVSECCDDELRCRMGEYANAHRLRFEALLNYLTCKCN